MADRQSETTRPQAFGYPSLWGRAWVRYPDGTETGLMPTRVARGYAKTFGGVVCRVTLRERIARMWRTFRHG